VKTLVIDASVVIKWVIQEEGTEAALALRGKTRFLAPDLRVPECANILWKKVQRRELSKQVALAAARLLQAADIELLPSRSLLGTATGLAIELEHPAYDCLYLALAMDQDCPFVTADQRLLRKLELTQDARLRGHVVGLEKAAANED
jgi:predicted nucleic acid-binding protein